MNPESPIQSVNGLVMNGIQATPIHIGDYPYRTGDFPGSYPYIGDPIVPQDPPIKIIPGKVDYYPLGPAVVPNVNSVWTTGFSLTPNPWAVTVTAEGLCCRCDVPGCKEDGLSVVINNGTITVSYKRFDTGGLCYPATQFIGADYDPTTAEATLEAGVLTINVKRFPPKAGIKVPVTVK